VLAVALLLFLLAACAPAAGQQAGAEGQGVVAVQPSSASIPPDYLSTQSALDLAQAKLAADQLAATQQAGVATAAVQQTADARAFERAGWTATLEAERGTATARAVGTATAGASARASATAAAWVPYANATYTALKDREAKDKARQQWYLSYMGYILALPYVLAGVVIVSIAAAIVLVGWSFWYRVRSEYGPAVQVLDMEDAPRLPGPMDYPQLTTTPRFIMDGQGNGRRALLPIDDYHLEILCRALSKGVTFAERNFSTRFVPNFRAVQDAFIEQGLATQRNPKSPQQGIVLTDEGRRFCFGAVLALPSPAWPDAENITQTHAERADARQTQAYSAEGEAG
jgi:hypothetical protein